MMLFIRILILIFAVYFIYKRLRSILQTSTTYKTGGRSGSDGEARDQQRKGDSRSQNSRRHNRNPYDVLGVSTRASREEVKRAYHELMAKYHPDKVAHLGEELQSLAKEKSQEIVQAYRDISCE